jgi:hypothetical protein
MKLAGQQVIQPGSLDRLAVVLDTQTGVDNLGSVVDNLGSVGDMLGFLGIHIVPVWLDNLCVDLDVENVQYYN